MSSTPFAVVPDINNTSSPGILVWPTINLYPKPANQDVCRKNRGSGAKCDHRGQAQEAGQMVQSWDALESDQRLLRGGQVGWGGRRVGAHRWSWKEMWSWRDVIEQLAFLKVETFADSSRDAEWLRHCVCVCVYLICLM